MWRMFWKSWSQQRRNRLRAKAKQPQNRAVEKELHKNPPPPPPNFLKRAREGFCGRAGSSPNSRKGVQLSASLGTTSMCDPAKLWHTRTPKRLTPGGPVGLLKTFMFRKWETLKNLTLSAQTLPEQPSCELSEPSNPTKPYKNLQGRQRPCEPYPKDAM